MLCNNIYWRKLVSCSLVVVLVAACSDGGGSNSPPIANAGDDNNVDANNAVTLDGSLSDDPDGSIVSYSWQQTAGIGVTLNNADTAQADFTAPAINGDLVFALTVTDNIGATDTDEVVITVENGVDMQPGLDARPDNMDCIAPASPGTAPGNLDLVDVFPDLDLSDLQFPLGMKQLPGNDDYFFAINRDGRLFRFDNDPTVTAPLEILDISNVVDTFNFEGGFLGFAFHPDAADNRAVYLSYTAGGVDCDGEGPMCSIISRVTLSANFDSIDMDSERRLIVLNQPAGNHNGGDIHFGPDGHLYIGFGDGGADSDTAQDTEILHGSMLRLDVDPTGDTAPYYSIPDDNPFAGSATEREEIYAWGLRNPFRWSFDMTTGVLWAADVGQNTREEVDHIINGGNYGWNRMEGSVCIADCGQFEGPVHDYDHSVGNSITGGYVYRGSDIPSLDGAYIFGDFGSGRIWTLVPTGSGYDREEVAVPDGSVVSFGQDNAGEVYVLLANPGDDRSIRKVQASTSAPGSNIPTLLSDTGCFNGNDPRQPDPGLIPFDVIAPLWSDGAGKERWMAIPNDETVGVDAQGDFDFPEGTILAKHFMNMGTLIETRLFMHHQTGWAGYSYEWNDSQSDATLLQGAKDVDDVTPDGLDWHFPSGAECRQCHTPVKNFALGPEVLQLNHDFTYPPTGRTSNQVFTLNSIGLFTAPPDASLNNATLYALDDTNASLRDRVKSYLHSNCSNCHQPGGPGRGTMDLRYQTALADMNICDVAPGEGDLGISGARLIAPGSPAQSIVLERMQRLDGTRMPPLASSVVDSEAVAVFTDWINGLAACP